MSVADPRLRAPAPTAGTPAPHLRLVHSESPEFAPESSARSDVDLFAGLSAEQPWAAECRERLVERYSWLALSCARRYTGRGENEDDLKQIACVGLIEAMNRFDATRGIEFEFFARPTVLGHIRRHFRDSRRWVRIPRRLQELGAEIKEARETLAEQNWHTPTLQELAQHVGARPSEVAEALGAEHLFAPTSLDTPVASDDGSRTTLGDLIGVSDVRLDLVVDWTALRPMLAGLPDREREIVVSIFWHDETQAVVGRRLGISQMQVSRILARTLRQLRAQLEA